MSNERSIKPADIIEHTQRMRLQIVDKLTDNGLELPTDPKDLGTLSMVLRDLDAAALTTRKLDVEEKAVDVASKASANVAAVLRSLGGGNPFKHEQPVIEGRTVPIPDEDSLPVVVTVPGHTKQGMDELVYEEFVVDENNPKD